MAATPSLAAPPPPTFDMAGAVGAMADSVAPHSLSRPKQLSYSFTPTSATPTPARLQTPREPRPNDPESIAAFFRARSARLDSPIFRSKRKDFSSAVPELRFCADYIEKGHVPSNLNAETVADAHFFPDKSFVQLPLCNLGYRVARNPIPYSVNVYFDSKLDIVPVKARLRPDLESAKHMFVLARPFMEDDEESAYTESAAVAIRNRQPPPELPVQWFWENPVHIDDPEAREHAKVTESFACKFWAAPCVEGQRSELDIELIILDNKGDTHTFSMRITAKGCAPKLKVDGEGMEIDDVSLSSKIAYYKDNESRQVTITNESDSAPCMAAVYLTENGPFKDFGPFVMEDSENEGRPVNDIIRVLEPGKSIEMFVHFDLPDDGSVIPTCYYGIVSVRLAYFLTMTPVREDDELPQFYDHIIYLEAPREDGVPVDATSTPTKSNFPDQINFDDLEESSFLEATELENADENKGQLTSLLNEEEEEQVSVDEDYEDETIDEDFDEVVENVEKDVNIKNDTAEEGKKEEKEAVHEETTEEDLCRVLDKGEQLSPNSSWPTPFKGTPFKDDVGKTDGVAMEDPFRALDNNRLLWKEEDQPTGFDFEGSGSAELDPVKESMEQGGLLFRNDGIVRNTGDFGEPERGLEQFFAEHDHDEGPQSPKLHVFNPVFEDVLEQNINDGENVLERHVNNGGLHFQSNGTALRHNFTGTEAAEQDLASYFGAMTLEDSPNRRQSPTDITEVVQEEPVKLRMTKAVREKGLNMKSESKYTVVAMQNACPHRVEVVLKVIGKAAELVFVETKSVTMEPNAKAKVRLVRNSFKSGKGTVEISAYPADDHVTAAGRQYRLELVVQAAVEARRPPAAPTVGRVRLDRPTLTFYKPEGKACTGTMRVLNQLNGAATIRARVRDVTEMQTPRAKELSVPKHNPFVCHGEQKVIGTGHVYYIRVHFDGGTNGERAAHYHGALDVLANSRRDTVPLFGYVGHADLSCEPVPGYMRVKNRGERAGYVIAEKYGCVVEAKSEKMMPLGSDWKGHLRTGDEIARSRLKYAAHLGVLSPPELDALEPYLTNLEGEIEAREVEDLNWQECEAISMNYAGRLFELDAYLANYNRHSGAWERIEQDVVQQWRAYFDSEGRVRVANGSAKESLPFRVRGAEPAMGKLPELGDAVLEQCADVVRVEARGRTIVLKRYEDVADK